MATKERRSSEATIETPYSMTFRVKGTRGFLFSRPPDSLDVKVPKIPKRADHEAKVWRVDDGLGYPGHQLVRDISLAGRGTKNPADGGKGSAMKSIRQALRVEGDEIVPFVLADDDAVMEWDDVLKHWVGIKHGGYTHRPYLEPGWELEFTLACAYPQWFSATGLHKLVGVTGMVGIGDGTPLGYGAFVIIRADPPEDLLNWI